MKPLLVQVVPITPCHVHESSVTLCLVCTCPLSTGILWWVSSRSSLLQAEKAPLLQASLTGQTLPPHDHLCVFPLDTPVCQCLCWAVGPHWAWWQRLSGVGWSSLHLCSDAPVDAAQDPACLCCCSRALLALPACPPGPPDPFQQGCFQPCRSRLDWAL